jgi:hypothetical protein
MAYSVGSRVAYRGLLKRLREIYHFEDMGVYGKILLK